MSIPPAPKDRFDHVLDFFFGSPKRAGRTMICIGIILGLIFIDDVIRGIRTMVYKIMSFAVELINQYFGIVLLIAIMVFGIRKLLKK